jgi:hypothetical protein
MCREIVFNLVLAAIAVRQNMIRLPLISPDQASAYVTSTP